MFAQKNMAPTGCLTQFPVVRENFKPNFSEFLYIFAGHVLCASCCTNIVEKTSPRLSPVCPFCREQFTNDSLRLIRMDFTTSGWSTPRRFPALETFNDLNTEILQRKTERVLNSDGSKTFEVRRLEDKVGRVAAKKCSVEEVSSLYKELEEWLLAEKNEQVRPIDSMISPVTPPRQFLFLDLIAFPQRVPSARYSHEPLSPFGGK